MVGRQNVVNTRIIGSSLRVTHMLHTIVTRKAKPAYKVPVLHGDTGVYTRVCVYLVPRLGGPASAAGGGGREFYVRVTKNP